MLIRPIARLVSFAIVVAACAGGGDESEPVPAACVAREPSLSLEASLRGREGEHRLVMVAVSGDSTDAEVSGSLWLAANDSAMQVYEPDPNVSMPSYGWTDAAIGTVAARVLGDLLSQDPSSPGVLVLEQQADPAAAPGITLRLGSLANQRDLVRFDGGYTALRVGWIDEAGGFGGTWASGVQQVEAEGHFCVTSVE